MPSFGAFVRDLETLCRKHGVTLAPAADGGVGVWDVVSGKKSELIDCTAPPVGAPRLDPLPSYFETGIAARQHAGYIGEALSQRLARDLQAQHAGSEVVPIGPRPRGWVVVRPQKKR